MRIVNLTTGRLLAARAEVADTLPTRMVGLLNRAALAPDEALIIPRCNAIHTWFMRFPIDVLFLDARGAVLRIVPSLRPFHMAWTPGAQTVVELPAGAASPSLAQPGQLLRYE